MHGKGAPDRRIAVPPGTIVTDADTARSSRISRRPEKRSWSPRGGAGGRGNSAFTSSVNQAPDQAEPGRPGRERRLAARAEAIAEIGLIGLPTPGKIDASFAHIPGDPRFRGLPVHDPLPRPRSGLHRGREIVVADLPGLSEGRTGGWGWGPVPEARPNGRRG